MIRAGHTADEPHRDYGYDVLVTTYNYRGDATFSAGEIENGHVFIQLKATDTLKVLADHVTLSCRIQRKHLDLWMTEVSPVYLVVYSVPDDTAYWLHMQPYLNAKSLVLPTIEQEEVVVHLSKFNVVTAEAIDDFRNTKQTAWAAFCGEEPLCITKEYIWIELPMGS